MEDGRTLRYARSNHTPCPVLMTITDTLNVKRDIDTIHV